MEKTLSFECKGRMIGLADDIVYLQKMFWCNASARQLHMSMMKPRHYFPYDPVGTYPVIIFLCGGAFQKCDRNVWMPNLTYFAERGYCVVGVEYSTLAYTEFPEQIKEIKAAVRFLRAHAEELSIDPDRIAVMGESAGAYLAALMAVSNGHKEYEEGPNLDQSSDVQAAIPWYAVTHMDRPKGEKAKTYDPIRIRTDNMPDLVDFVDGTEPPIALFHGTNDVQVNYSHSKRLYDKLIAAGDRADLYLVEGAGHADRMFVEPCVKQIMADFLDEAMGR